MGIIEDIKKMQSEGRSDQEITLSLQSRGSNPQEIYEALSQTRIKDAVAGDTPHMDEPSMPQIQSKTEMQPSLMSPSQEQKPSQAQPPQAPSYQEYSETYSQAPVQQYSQQSPQEYSQPQYQDYYSAGPSSDTISEIAEQVVAEKLHNLKQDIEKIIDLKNTVDSKIEYIDERLKRIEKIIDRLQLSILQKVGDYITNVEDIKNELAETQKSFKALLPESRKSSDQERRIE